MRPRALALALLLLAAPAAAQAPARTTEAPPARESRAQTRPHGSRVVVDVTKVVVDDGDTANIQWGEGDTEVVRILGIDTPETRHPEHDLPYAQSFGPEARAFAMGAFATANEIQLLRSATLDTYGRTLGYFFLNGKNYSTLVVRAGLAEESVTRYGDNGLPAEAAEVSAAARQAGATPFESPGTFRRRMRDVSAAMKSKGIYPEQ